MAFVTRSEKYSHFEMKQSKQIKNSQDKVYQSQPNERIHIGADQQFRRLLGQKTKKLRQYNSIKKSQPSIPSENKCFSSLENQQRKKHYSSFKNLRKRRYENKINDGIDSSQDQITQQYSIPGSLSPKTMVKYVKTQSKSHKFKQAECISPGPDTYNPQLPKSHSQSPVLKPDNYSQTDYLKQLTDEQLWDKDEERLFAVRYKTMNSSVFKKSPNLVNLSNKNLINKLFSNKQDKNERENQKQIHDCQFTQVTNTRPGPTQYHKEQKQNNKGVLFGNTKRFICNLSDGTNKFYNITKQAQAKCPQSEAFYFASQVQRFQKQNNIQTPLQYTSFQNSLINFSKNRKYSGFSPKLDPISPLKMDDRPYYNIKKIQKREFMAKFSQYQQKRNIFHVKQNDEPGPANYCVSPKWQKEHGCIFGKESKFKTFQTMQSQNKDYKTNIFFLASQSTLENDQILKKPKYPKQKLKQAKAKVKIDKKMEIYGDKYYDTLPSWEKKSFNIHFVNDILPANNPIKNKIL